MPCSRARSLPGAIGKWMSAALAVSVRRGSTTTILTLLGFLRFRFSSRWNSTGWHSAVLVPIRNATVQWSRSS